MARAKGEGQMLGTFVTFMIAMILLGGAVATNPPLSESYYLLTCPNLTSTVSNVVDSLVQRDNTLPAAWLRLHFHDCFVNGCDASVLINGSDPNQEINAFPNLHSLRGLDVLETVKAAVEQVCPGKVSCADILALVARDAVNAIQRGVTWKVPFGRRDGVVSSAAAANVSIPRATYNYTQLVQNFSVVGLTPNDMVVLSGAHTIGLTHCGVIQPRLYNFSGSPNGVDPTLDATYATHLQQECPPDSASAGIIIPMDPTGNNQTFDSMYFTNVLTHKGLFTSDAALITDTTAKIYVKRESRNILNPFFIDFGLAMEKLGRINVLTGSQGQIRKVCSAFNT